LYLIDTNVVSEFIKPSPNSRVIDWVRRGEPQTLFVSAITAGELRLGTEAMPLSKRRTELERWLDQGLPDWFSSNLLPVTKDIADRWGRVTIRPKRGGVTLVTPDGLIAATALEHNLTLVTRNVKDFAGLGVSLLNPWEPQP
jgi:predicted nucleic acid-binding protein